MHKRFYFYLGLVVVALCLSLVFFTGCAKKKVEPIPSKGPGVEGEMNATEMEKEARLGPAEKEGKVSEYGLKGEQAKQKAKEEAEKELALSKKEAKMKLNKKIHFAFDSYELNSEAREILKKKAEILEKYKNIDLVIEGHCDERGTDEYNLALGERRARAAYEFLILLGIDADRLNIISYGEERPIAEGHNEQAWAKNRRDEFRVIESS